MRRKDREIKDIQLIESIIQSADVCRIALFDGNYPYIVTMNFGYKKGNPSCIYFHSAPSGKKIEILKFNNKACFEFDIDHKLKTGELACDFGMYYKSVVGFGKLFIINDEKEKLDGLNHIMKHYVQQDQFVYDPRTLSRTTVLKLEIEEISGKSRN